MKPLSKQNNFAYLFISILLFLLSAAGVAEFDNIFSQGAFWLLIVVMLFSSNFALQSRVSWRRTLTVLLPLFVILSILQHFFPGRLYILLVLFTLLLFFVGTFSMAFRQVLFEGEIDANKLIGSLTLYMLLGLIWAVVYLMLMVIDPAAFSGIEISSWQATFSRMAYYSFVTLTTLGYGDILPKNHIAEFFAYMEAVIGVFYMAIIVSSLISLRLSTITRERGEK